MKPPLPFPVRLVTPWLVLGFGWAVGLALPALAALSVTESKHNLAVSGPGTYKAVTETEICIFCHTPHRAGEVPLWNHQMSGATYTPYQSSTLKATVGQPTGASKLCLSCHDGTVALGMVRTRPAPIAMRDSVTVLPPGPARLGTDLSDDHPVSFKYDAALASAHGQLRDPASLKKKKTRLDHDGQMQCTACHDPHDNQYGKFLVEPNPASALCLNCHDPDRWDASAHRTSAANWNGQGLNPWPNSAAKTVKDNACGNCHAPHAAAAKPRLLTFPTEEQACGVCHGGTVAAKNVQSEFNKFSAHPILKTSGVHDPAEDPLNPPRHVECVDCHNPHAAKNSPASAPFASGALAGVVGINSAGSLVRPLTMEYELCYRCHADSVERGPARVLRQFPQTNTRLEFKPSNLSFHPIETVGRNPDVPSLIAPWTPSSRMYCTDCHNNDQGPGAGGNGPNGPHGSAFEPILERQLLLTDFNTEGPSAYALCYKCHSRDSILRDESFKGHRKHVVEVKAACTTCHDPHGVANKPALINFNPLYVKPSSSGRLDFTRLGPRRGSCALTCHGRDHNPLSYAP